MTNTDTQKQKFAPENFSNSDPKKRRTEKNGKRRRTRHKKHKVKKNGQHFPLRRGGKKAAVTVTVAGHHATILNVELRQWWGHNGARPPPYRRGSNRPRVDSQQETGNPGRRNPQRQGVGRHCGRSTGVALDLMHTSNAKRNTRRTITDHDKQPKHRPTQTHPRRNQTAPGPEPSKHPNRKTSDGDEKKNRCGA